MQSNKKRRLPTHTFLASIGKTVLRPGGKEATNRLLNACSLNENTKLLEVAPNMGTTAIHIAKTYGVKVIGIDINKDAVEKAQLNIKKHGLEHMISIKQGDATNLPFEDESFDVVLNEAMLTMLPNELKEKALKEYYRVLKPGGYLLTHDLLVKKEKESTLETTEELNEQQLKELQDLIVVKAQPLKRDAWITHFEKTGFTSIDPVVGELHLLSLKGLLNDEGVDGIITMLQNARKNEEDFAQFTELVNEFDAKREFFGHIYIVARKPL